jgi:hypothetical protein
VPKADYKKLIKVEKGTPAKSLQILTGYQSNKSQGYILELIKPYILLQQNKGNKIEQISVL